MPIDRRSVAIGAITLATGAHADLAWEHQPRIELHETITPISNGQYRYDFDIPVNRETEGIWQVIVYSSRFTFNSDPFEQDRWLDVNHVVQQMYDVYDPRSIDPTLQYATSTFGIGWPNPDDAIDPGETTTGFSFVMSEYDPSPKLFLYETVGSYAVDTGTVAAVGYTIPAPASILTLGMLGARRRR